MEPITASKIAKEIYEAANKIQKVYNVSQRMKSVADSEGKDQIMAIASNVSKMQQEGTEGKEGKSESANKEIKIEGDLYHEDNNSPNNLLEGSFVHELDTSYIQDGTISEPVGFVDKFPNDETVEGPELKDVFVERLSSPDYQLGENQIEYNNNVLEDTPGNEVFNENNYNREMAKDYATLRDDTSSAEDKSHAIANINNRYRENPYLEQKRYEEIPEDIRSILDRFHILRYSDSGYNHIPKTGGSWEGECGNSKFRPDSNIRPKDKGYSNMNNKTWGQILNENKIDGILYNKGNPDFSPIAEMQTKMDFNSDISQEARQELLSNPPKRTKLHEEFYKKLALENNCTVDEIKKLKEKNNWVVHECNDCKTIMLLPREVHDNLPHTGGVEMFRTLNGI